MPRDTQLFLLSNRNIRSLKVSLEELKELVETNDKQRFSLVPAAYAAAPHGNSATVDATVSRADPSSGSLNAGQPGPIHSKDPRDYLIRANQGHSIAIDSESLLTKIEASDAPTTCVHGTTHHAWTLIVKSGGLKRMTRQHVHFAAGLPKGFKSISDIDAAAEASLQEKAAVAPVISGMRNSSTILIFIDIKKALEDGLKFWKSANDVLLTEGNDDGLVPLTYFKRVEDRTGGQGVLLEDGQILKEPPAEWATKGSGQRGGRSGGRKRGGKDAAA
ncbi:RNA 2'-phosphotransferase-like protein [Elsinoe fawcettii]|nr:RNA 2'-phosphotransferase-like protein [Elsinoe fawcettii]